VYLHRQSLSGTKLADRAWVGKLTPKHADSTMPLPQVPLRRSNSGPNRISTVVRLDTSTCTRLTALIREPPRCIHVQTRFKAPHVHTLRSPTARLEGTHPARQRRRTYPSNRRDPRAPATQRLTHPLWNSTSSVFHRHLLIPSHAIRAGRVGMRICPSPPRLEPKWPSQGESDRY
jgi:hypothetical protein